MSSGRLFLAAIAAIVIGLALLTIANINTGTTAPANAIVSETNHTNKQLQPAIAQLTVQNITNISTVSVYAPAVDNNGNGIVTKLSVEAMPGSGRILLNINNLQFWTDTQQSIQTAVEVAQEITHVNLSNTDLIYSIDTNASVIEGPSAGATLTMATIAAIEHIQPNASIMMTGTINPDGTIGPVGGITAKANAAESIGAKLFLVPEGQGLQTNYVAKDTCQQLGSFTFCTTKYVEQTVNTTTGTGIHIVEVPDIQQALKYFLP